MKRILPLTFLLVLLAISASANAYLFTSVYQDDGSSDHVVEAPSFYWEGSCTVSNNLFGTASNVGSYSLSNEWFSPNDNLIATSTPVYANNINCLSQGVATSTNSLNDFYETKSETISTASSTDTWLRTIYNCTPDEDLNIIYSNTNVLDSHNHFPYGYIENTGGYCQVGSAGTLPTISARLTLVTDYIKDKYDTECSSTDLEIAEIGGAPQSCALNRFFGTTFWYLVPFNSGSAGVVNISIIEQIEREDGDCNMNCITNNTYLYDTVLDSTTSLGISLPLTQNLVIQRDRDYWLLLGTECVGGTGGTGSCTISYNHSDYNITIFAYEPNFICGDWTTCESSIQTRVCTDAGGLVPDIIETRSCFDTPTFDLSLGFEEFDVLQDGAYRCTVPFACVLSLETIDVRYPRNWTVIGEFDVSGINRANNIEISSDTASVGSRSLKMWSIPYSKIAEPVAGGGGTTSCGNLTGGRSPEINHPYNDSLFIAQNITFDNPFAQIRYDVTRCPEPVLQYDVSGQLGSGVACGITGQPLEVCYAKSCNATDFGEPKGRYVVRVDRLAGNLVTIDEQFNMTNGTGTDITANVTDGTITTWGPFLTESGVIVVNSTSNIFFNGTRINLILNVTFPGGANMCFFDTSNNQELTRFSMGASDVIETHNITLGNVTSPSGIDEINFSSCGGGDQNASMFEFQVLNSENLTTSSNIFQWDGVAPDTWDAGQFIHDLSNANLETGVNYTISISVNPESNEPLTHCVYFDNFRITFTELALPECVSECIEDSIDRRIGTFADGVCTFVIQTNSPDCIADRSQRTDVENIIAGRGGGTISDNSTCIDTNNDGITDDLFTFDPVSRKTTIVLNSSACLELLAEEQRQLTLYDPPEFAQGILLGFGLTQSAFGYIWFFFSIFMLINYVALGLGIGITVYLIPLTQPPQGMGQRQDSSFIPFLATVLIVIIGALFSGFYPLEIGIPLVVGLGLLLWKQIETLVGGHGGR